MRKISSKYDEINYRRIEKFLIEECGYKSVEEAVSNYTPLNLYPLIGDLSKKEEK